MERRRKPRTPTSARPGSPEKIAVMRARHEANEELYHPDDETTCKRPAHVSDDRMPYIRVALKLCVTNEEWCGRGIDIRMSRGGGRC